jgi:glycosyltransferase involved in cell wall biosynthesis
MKIGLDGRALQVPRTGIGRYVFEICRELGNLLPNADFFVYAQAPVELPVKSERWRCRTEPRRWARELKPVVWLKLRAGLLCREDCLDAFWASATLLPSLPSGVRRLTTVHDLAFRIVPETMSRTHLMAQRLFFAKDVQSADHRFAVSKGTAARLHAWLGGEPAIVVPPGISGVFRPGDPVAIERTLVSLGITRPYFLAVGTWEPRKNLDLIVRVFREMQWEGEFRDYHLVLVGGGGWKDKRLRALLHSGTKAPKGRSVIPLGFVPDDQLAQLYSGCQALVFPSRYEGFGIPVLEARACGAAVVASDLPELREAGGDSALYIEPTPQGLREGLRRVITHPPMSPAAPHILPSWRASAEKMASYLT